MIKTSYEVQGTPAKSSVVNEALGVLKARATYDCPSYELSYRVAHRNGEIFIDTGNDKFQVIKITDIHWVRWR